MEEPVTKEMLEFLNNDCVKPSRYYLPNVGIIGKEELKNKKYAEEIIKNLKEYYPEFYDELFNNYKE